MLGRLSISLAIAVFAVSIVIGSLSSAAGASIGSGGYSSASAGASAGDGQVTVSAGQIQGTPTSSTVTSKGGSSGNSGLPATSDCGQTVASPQVQQLLGVGGATPGYWVDFTCPGGAMTDPIPLQWVVAPPTPVAANVGLLALLAKSKLALATPTIQTAPPSGQTQLVGVPTWLWIGPGPWQDMNATATAGAVVVTATAIPAKVVWNMGDGTQVSCNGPGVAYNPNTPSATTDCSHTWAQPSSGEPGGDYQVTATVYWQVAWTAAGAPGGGAFGLVAGPTTTQQVRVTESQAINTPNASGN
jgi:hypothetical protein